MVSQSKLDISQRSGVWYIHIASSFHGSKFTAEWDGFSSVNHGPIYSAWGLIDPSEKWWSSSVGMMTFPLYGKIMKNKIHVPNLQPVFLPGHFSTYPRSFFRDNANSWRDVFSSTMGLKSLRYSTPFDHQILGLIKHIVPLNPPVDHNNAVIICNNYRNNI